MKSKILITGASGYIGSCLYLYLKKNFNIFGIDKKTTKILPIKKCNLLNLKKLNSFLKKEKPDLIVHFAAQSLVDETINKKKYFQNNVLATQNLILGMKKNNLDNIIFSSTAALYKYKNEIISEKSTLKPLSTYAKTKYKCEKIVEKNFKVSPVNYKIFRFFTVYGPYGRPDMFIHKLLNALKKNKRINIHNKGKNLRDFTYVDDVVKILINYSIINNKIKILNIARSKPIKNIDLIYEIKKIYRQKKENFNFIKTVKGEMLKTHGCNKKLINNFKKFKFTKLNEGLVKTIKIFKKYGI